MIWTKKNTHNKETKTQFIKKQAVNKSNSFNPKRNKQNNTPSQHILTTKIHKHKTNKTYPYLVREMQE